MKRIVRIKKRIKQSLEKYYTDNEKGSNKELNIYDLLAFYIEDDEFVRMDVCIYYLAIEQYHKKNNIGYSLLKKALMANKKQIDISTENEIDNYVKKIVLDSDKHIVLDKKFNIIDGSESIAYNLYQGIDTVNVITIPIESINSYNNFSIDWLIENNFNNMEIDIILEISRLIKNKIQSVTFSCLLWPPVVEFANDILKDLNRYCEVVSSFKYSYSKEEFEKKLFDIYLCDDIEEWKIQKKYEHMKQYNPVLCLIELKIKAKYRIKNKTNMPISTTGERIKRAIRSKYSKKISDYYYDIVIHIADNKKQSEFIKELFLNDKIS